MFCPIIWGPILHVLTDHVRAHVHLCLNPGWFPNLIDMLQTYKVMPLCGKLTSNFLRRSICLFVEHSLVSAHESRRHMCFVTASSVVELARTSLLAATISSCASKIRSSYANLKLFRPQSYDTLLSRRYTHTVILMRPLIVGVKQLWRATQKGKSAAPYLFTRLNNSFKALNLLPLVFLLLQLERQRTWTEFSWKAKSDKLLTYFVSLLAWWSS